VELSGDLETWLGLTLAPTLLWDYPTIVRLANYLAECSCSTPLAVPSAIEPASQEIVPLPAEQPSSSIQREPIAIIGIGCRFPGACGPEAFWQLLCERRDAITEVTPERWDPALFYDPDPLQAGKTNSRWGGFLSIEQIEQFDAPFFHISSREARAMDPQQRLLLEVAWEALEDAGQDISQLAGCEGGVFIGIANSDYGRAYLSDPSHLDAYAGTGNVLSIAANRLSYCLDWHGPSMAIDTACSSSLVAVHLACQSLWNEESALAMAGGVNLVLAPTFAINFSKAGVMATDGRCKTFDQRADGYVRGEGVGVVVLKPLALAQRDHDPIYAVIRGSAVNQDGRTNGLMAPNGLAQRRVVQRACQRAGIQPAQIQYVETHGTGTVVGDAIEAQALGEVLADGRPADRPCLIGSVKTNIGHLEAAAGIAGVIKVALALKHRQIPPSLHFETANPAIPFAPLRLRVNTSMSPLPIDEQSALAGVSSFGFGGTNAHLILAAAPVGALPAHSSTIVEPTAILPLSAHSPQALYDLAQRYCSFLQSPASSHWEAVCATASLRRTHYEHRLAVVASSSQQASGYLQAFVRSGFSEEVVIGYTRPEQAGRHGIVFVFSGQGAQWYGMGRQLLLNEPVFRQTVEACEQVLRLLVPWSLLTVLTAVDTESMLEDIAVVQPVLFAIAAGLAALWRSWGIEPAAVIGHSMGEVAAAYVAGALSLEDACLIVCERSKLLHRVRGQGGMLAAEVSLSEAHSLLHEVAAECSIAVHNGSRSVVFAGPDHALTQLSHYLEQRNIFCRRVNVDVAAHSAQIGELQLELQQRLANIQPRQASIPIYSTVQVTLCTGQDMDANYWGRNLREPVRFADTIELLLQEGYTHFLEISPHPLLKSPIELALQEHHVSGVVLGSLQRKHDECATLLKTLSVLYTHGYSVQWSRLYAQPSPYVALPTYPWQHERFPLDLADFWNRGMFSSQTGPRPEPLTPDCVPTETFELAPTSVASEPQTILSDRCWYEFLAAIEDHQQRVETVEVCLREHIARILDQPVSLADDHVSLLALGMDSITILELKRRLLAQQGVTLSIATFWKYPTLHLLAVYICQQVDSALSQHHDVSELHTFTV
jgi:acyl transferase domain-containing protein